MIVLGWLCTDAASPEVALVVTGILFYYLAPISARPRHAPSSGRCSGPPTSVGVVGLIGSRVLFRR
jgi:hypothetical protein